MCFVAKYFVMHMIHNISYLWMPNLTLNLLSHGPKNQAAVPVGPTVSELAKKPPEPFET